jgi:hypothetical protein
MPSFLLISPLAVFLGIAAVGFLFLAVTWLFGDLFEHDADLDHDFDAGHDIAGHEHGGPSILSTRVISVFITAFGGGGAIGTSLGWGTLASSLLGLAGGTALGWVVYMFARFLYSQQASSDISLHDLLGQPAQVTVAIPRSGLGQVQCLVGETRIEKIARSDDGSEIPLNTLVRIEDTQADVVTVRKIEAMVDKSAVERLLEE